MQEPDEPFDGARLLIEVSGGADQAGDARQRRASDGAGRQEAGAPERLERLLDVRPGDPLGEDGAQHDLEAAARRPPALRAVRSPQRPVPGEKRRAPADRH